MLSEWRKEEMFALIEKLKETVIGLHGYVEDNDKIDDSSYDEIDSKITEINLIIGKLEREIYFS